MIARFRDLCLDANDPAVVGAFWAAVLGRTLQDAGQGDGTTSDIFLEAGADGGPRIYVNGVPEPKTVKDRIHLDVTLEPGQEIPDLLRLDRRGGADVVDASVVVCAWQHEDVVVTSDPADLRRLDPTLRLVAL